MAVDKGFKIATAYVEIVTDNDAAKKAVKDLPKTVGPDADRSGTEIGKRVGKTLKPEMDRQGRDAGGKLAQGIHLSVVRNSPLIAAAIGGALAAGAPLAIAGATTLFGGVAAVAAAQSIEVRSAWNALGRDIRDGAVEDAQILVPTFVRMADDIGEAFEDLRPKIRDAFEDLAPQIDDFSGSVIHAGTAVTESLIRAVEDGRPVMQGFGDFVEDTGDGLAGFFDNISAHSPAAGQAFSSLGDIMGDLLPVLGEVLGQGAELAADVLPVVASALGIVRDVTEDLGPLLPAIATGFAAMKIAQTAGGWLRSFSGSAATVAQNLAFASYQGGAFGRSAGALSNVVGGVGDASSKAGRAINGMGAGLPALGILIAGISNNLSDVTDEESRWANALLEGGQAAATANAEMDNQSDYLLRGLDEWTGLASSVEDAKAEYDSILASMSPVQRAHTLLEQATNDLAFALDDESASSADVAEKQALVDQRTRELEAAQGELETALHGVTAAMIEQADQALAGIDSGFAYRNSIDALEDAQTTLNEAIRDHGRGSEEAQRAQLALEEQSYRTALAYGQQQADLSGLSADSAEYARIVQTEMLGELYRLRDAAGPQMAGAIQQQIDMLEASGVSLGETGIAANAVANRMRDLGLSVTQVPGQKGVIIDAPTADQKRRIEDLGYKIITLPNKRVIVSADASSANATLNAFLARQAAKYIPIIGFLSGAAAADGGNVGQKIKGFPRGGKISGPGSRTSDSILAMSESGPLRVSDDEWVINGSVSARQGDSRMAALNAGRAEIVPHGASPSTGTGSGGSGRIGELHVHIAGTFDFTDRRGLRRAAEALRDELVELERSYR